MGKNTDPDAPKRPLSAFFLFSGEMRPKIRKENPGLSLGEMGKELGKRWASIDAASKKKYEKTAAAAKLEYQEKMAKYKGTKSSPAKGRRKIE
ncbi:high mobility group protein B2 [Folsomia candida]|uniref:high mobility group protein B2 n=1 Tax=Folsomia candida TaxID=158441 RepID=UPI000B8F1F02|nr:high mobility group protein B2 [Folsomia candida]